MSQLLPQSLAGALSQPGGQEQADPLEDLQATIDAMHELLRSLTDPGDVHQAATALRILTGIQQRMMSEQGAPGGAASAPPQ